MLIPTVGIEVHVELKSKTKVYSDSLNNFDIEANKNMTLIDYGYPGMLPTLNKEVIDMALKTALALNCKINKTMHWDRKNYFYPDLPKGYQITQQETPIGYDGYLEIDVSGTKKRIGIERIHIEEDTCKSIHSIKGTKLNFNRAGVPLIEIVSKPDIANGLEAMAYVEALRLNLLYLGVSDVKIEEGSMRCDTNVSVKEQDAKVLGTRCEIKNIGSITNIKTSINYEVKRQTELINSGQKVVAETRRFDDKTGATILMRVKETGNDYRYFPEVDIPYVTLSDKEINDCFNSLPVLPTVLKEKYMNNEMTDIAISTILANPDICHFFEDVFTEVNPVVASNLLTGDIMSYLNKEKVKLKDTKLTKNNFKDLVNVLANKDVSSKQGKVILEILLNKGGDVVTIIKDHGMEQISDDTVLYSMIDKVLAANPDSIKDFKDGKDRALKYLMGMIMKESHGQANPALVNKLLIENLKKY